MKKNSQKSDCQHILLVGCTNGALRTNGNGYQRCDNMLDAIDLASHERFDAIYIKISSIDGRVPSAISALRRISGTAKIYLLAAMYEEPMARLMTARRTGPPGLADDYFICPADIRRHVNEQPTKQPAAHQQIMPLQSDDKDARIVELEKLATEDDLTSLKNRRYTWEFLRQITERAKKEELQVMLLVFDIDDFKHYNDTYGHAVGDNVLRQAAVVLRRCCREHDVIGRIGGDEFAVVFWDCPKPQDAQKVVDTSQSERRSAKVSHPREVFFISERFRREIGSAELSFLGDEGKGVLSISGGLASFPRDGATVEELFEQADSAMLDAKRSGKNQIYLVGKPQ